MQVEAYDNVTQALQEKFGDQLERVETHYDFPVFILKKDKIRDIIHHLYHHPATKFQYLTTLCGIHYADQNQIAIMYQLHNLVSNQRIRIKTFLPEQQPQIDSITTVFAGANWMERETFDFYGVHFTGHPDLRRILNVEDMIIHPLRKEYPLEDQTREDKNDTMFGR